MECYRDVNVSSTTLSADALARYIESFAERASDWEFPTEKSLEYEKRCGEPSCCVIYTHDTLPRAAIHLTRKAPQALYVTNIVPLVLHKLTYDQYNSIALTFARSLRFRSKSDGLNIRVSMSRVSINLSNIVTGKIPAKLFKQYLGVYPLSYHPSDINRLDKFICAISRFSRKPFNLDALQHLLVEELKWSLEDAKWCRGRVETGLEVLQVYKRF